MIVDDHTLFRRGLTALLGCDPRLEGVADAADASAALKRAKELGKAYLLDAFDVAVGEVFEHHHKP